MKRLSAIEKGAIALGLLLFAFGVYMTLYPSEAIVLHPAPSTYKGPFGPSRPEHVTKAGARFYGGLELCLGGAILWLALRRNRE